MELVRPRDLRTGRETTAEHPVASSTSRTQERNVWSVPVPRGARGDDTFLAYLSPLGGEVLFVDEGPEGPPFGCTASRPGSLVRRRETSPAPPSVENPRRPLPPPPLLSQGVGRGSVDYSGGLGGVVILRGSRRTHGRVSRRAGRPTRTDPKRSWSPRPRPRFRSSVGVEPVSPPLLPSDPFVSAVTGGTV